jgi:zinc transporter
MTNHILLAYEFDGQGGAKTIESDAISSHVKNDQLLTWIHLDANHEDTRPWLETELDYLDNAVIEALLEDVTRPRMMQFEEGVLLILRGVNLNENADPEDMISIRLWVDEHRIISMRRRRMRAIGDIEARLLQGTGPVDSGDFVCLLAARLFDRMEPVLSLLDETTDDIEEKILEYADAALRQSIIEVRKKAIIFRRYMAPQRDAISHLRMSELNWLDKSHKIDLQESYNHVTRYVEDLDAIRERAQIVKDELANIIADKLNRNMYVLSVIAAIFLPLGFLTGLLGINVGGIPGAENTNAFMMFCGILIVVVIIQVVVFKRFKWF